MERAIVDKWLSEMPFDRRYKVTPAQAELVREWMRKQPKYDGGLNFNKDFTEIYKIDVSMLE